MEKEMFCSICGKKVEQSDLMDNGEPDMINGAVTGEYIEVRGHRACVRNVDQIVVLENRVRIISFIDLLKKKLEEEKLMNDELDKFLESAKMIYMINPDAVPKA